MKKKSVLVIEDNDLNRKLIRDILAISNGTNAPYLVFEADNAEMGIQLVKENPPDIILMDIELPGMDGLSAIKILKDDPALSEIPIIVLSAYAMDGDIDKALTAGCNGYITKPIDIKAFRNLIHDFLDR